MSREQQRALVTGGAGLIGSHLVDQLLDEGWAVRILDSLEPQTHGRQRPAWIDDRAQFRHGDVRSEIELRSAIEDVDVVFHLAAYGGYMPEIAHYVDVNSLGTARLLEVIRRSRAAGGRLRKLVVASSQSVYEEGAVRCPEHGIRFPPRRSTEQLAAGRFDIACPDCGAATEPATTPEGAPAGAGTVYGLTKFDQERLALMVGAQIGLPVVALRYACTYGPRQSLHNPYTGVITIFCTRLVNGLRPVVYEDGRQTRDLLFVEDTARATRFAAATDALDGQAINVGSGRATAIGDLARVLAAQLGVPHLEPELAGEFRPGEMRALTADVSRIEKAGWTPRISLEAGLERHLCWLREQGRIEERFTAARERLSGQKIVHRVVSGAVA